MVFYYCVIYVIFDTINGLTCFFNVFPVFVVGAIIWSFAIVTIIFFIFNFFEIVFSQCWIIWFRIFGAKMLSTWTFDGFRSFIVIMLEEAMFTWNNIEATSKLLNGHWYHKACQQICNITISIVPFVNTFRHKCIIESKFYEIT